MAGVLEDIKVLDFTRVIAGTFCTMYMADLGADVFKVELPGIGEVMRVQPPGRLSTKWWKKSMWWWRTSSQG